MDDVERIEQAAAHWLIRREHDAWDEADQAALDAWLSATEHRVAYLRLQHVWRRGDRLVVLRSGRLARRAVIGVSALHRVAAAVAALAIALSIGLLATTYKEPPPEAFATAVGQRQLVRLSDGTRIELNTQTKLATVMKKHRREVRLERGEAYFDVAHDEKRPFEVLIGKQRITVLGTKFAVRRDGPTTKVVVVQGRVQVEQNAGASTQAIATLVRGDMATVGPGGILIGPRSESRMEGDLAWRRGMLTFDDISLDAAAREFNRYNAVQLSPSPSVANMRIAGSFEARNIEAFVDLLGSAYGLKVEKDAGTLKISR